MVEIRKDYFTERLSIVTSDRALRPNPAKQVSAHASKCPFCPGNEEMTPPADLVLVRKGETLAKQTDTEGELIKDWIVRAFPNKYPIVTPSASPSYGEYPHYSEPAIGYHYVLVATPKHGEHFAKVNIEQWTNILASVQDKVRWLYGQRGVSFVLVFINSGKEAGATIDHPHLQMVTVPRLPPVVELEAINVQNSLNDLGICPMCQVVAAESGGPRQILSTEFYLAYAPWASTLAYEFWIYPKRHQTSILKLSQKELMDLSLILRSTLGGMAKALGDCSFNLVIHSSSEKKTTKQIHWHIEVFPKLTTWAGLELGGGIYASEVSPEAAAEQLGAASRKELAQLVGIT
ncbi:MAG: galactose-1-phosphate uridylyltransferase [Thaumarchaeota archaeon]|nr:galactose-1-phosphate uridylyltransferase [Nitrososphaerota archaeon]